MDSVEAETHVTPVDVGNGATVLEKHPPPSQSLPCVDVSEGQDGAGEPMTVDASPPSPTYFQLYQQVKKLPEDLKYLFQRTLDVERKATHTLAKI